MPDGRAGIYFLGDDGAYAWALALLHSVRVVCPDVPVHCIPYSDKLDRLGRLQTRYNFTLWDDPSLAELDRIGHEILGHSATPYIRRMIPTFRKLYTFWGPFDRFLYLDADIIALDGFPELFGRATAGRADVGYAHADIEQVYRLGPLRDRMVTGYSTSAINTGLWSSRFGVLTLDRVRELAAEASQVAQGFCDTYEQPFLNYCLDRSCVEMQQFDPPGRGCLWAGDAQHVIVNAETYSRLAARWPDGSLAPAVHWAGFRLSSRMPHYHIHRHFRWAASSPLGRLKLLGQELLQMRGPVLAGRVWRRGKRVIRGN